MQRFVLAGLVAAAAAGLTESQPQAAAPISSAQALNSATGLDPAAHLELMRARDANLPKEERAGGRQLLSTSCDAMASYPDVTLSVDSGIPDTNIDCDDYLYYGSSSTYPYWYSSTCSKVLHNTGSSWAISPDTTSASSTWHYNANVGSAPYYPDAPTTWYKASNGIANVFQSMVTCEVAPTLGPTSAPSPLPTVPLPSSVPSPVPSVVPFPAPTSAPSPVPTVPLPSSVPSPVPSPAPSPLPTTYDDREYLDRNAKKKLLRKAKHIARVEKNKAMKLAKEAEKSMH